MDPKVTNVRTTAQSDNAQNSAPAAKNVKLNITEVVDVLGRKIVVKKLNALEKMRLTKLAGSDSDNAGYSSYIMLAASVVSIDDEPENFPMTIRAVESMVSQLGDEGLEAVGEAAMELNGINIEEGIAHAKN
jgi:hypothetical protein